ncbi:MAG TPA: hypothetical protein VE076_13595, partial [Nitrososphaeraceae archaeon]|nr:hypothetical protein [Nitrososphaeraceae archaeon]
NSIFELKRPCNGEALPQLTKHICLVNLIRCFLLDSIIICSALIIFPYVNLLSAYNPRAYEANL